MTLENELGLKVDRFDEICRSAELRGVKKMETIWRNQTTELTNRQSIHLSAGQEIRSNATANRVAFPLCNTPHAG